MRFLRNRYPADAPQSLLAFTLCTLIAVAAVVWLAGDLTPWLVILAMAVTVALGAALLRMLRGEMGESEDDAPPGTGRLRRGAVLLAVAPALVVPVIAVAVGEAEAGSQDTPALTVRDFLTAAVVGDDGETACSYLTSQPVVDFEGPDRLHSTCESFFGGATLDLGGPIATNAQVDALHYAVRARGAERIVTVSHAGHAMRFVLQPATPSELNEFLAPPTAWRISSSVNRLGEPPRSPRV